MSRYLIIGCSGSGKSTLAQKLAHACGVPYINTDALYWKDDWTVASNEDVIQAIDLDADAYVLDGNFVSSREKVWSKVDTIIWLNYNRSLVLRRLFFRNMRWWIAGGSPWTGTRMNFQRAWSGIWHGYTSYDKKRAAYPGYLSRFPDKKIYIVTSPKQADRLLQQLCA